MVVNFSCIMPHGSKLISELYPDMDEKSKNLANAMKKVAKQLREKDPQLIIIASPHNLRICNHIGIITTEWLKGSFTEETGISTELQWKCNRSFATSLYIKAKESNIPIVAVNAGASEGEMSSLFMDWGTLIPLYFIKEEYKKEGKEKDLPPVILITPSREIEWNDLRLLGQLISKLSEEENVNVAFIASADQGHAHDSNGPYGYDKASEEYDQLVCELVKKNQLSKLFDVERSFIEKAKPDSLWQIFILQGIIDKTKLKSKLCVYECPEYYGMLVASFS